MTDTDEHSTGTAPVNAKINPRATDAGKDDNEIRKEPEQYTWVCCLCIVGSDDPTAGHNREEDKICKTCRMHKRSKCRMTLARRDVS